MLQSVIECYRVLQSITEYNRVLQNIIEYYRALQSIREYNRVLQKSSASTWTIFWACLILIQGVQTQLKNLNGAPSFSRAFLCEFQYICEISVWFLTCLRKFGKIQIYPYLWALWQPTEAKGKRTKKLRHHWIFHSDNRFCFHFHLFDMKYSFVIIIDKKIILFEIALSLSRKKRRLDASKN